MTCKLRFFADFCLALTASQTLIRDSLDFIKPGKPKQSSYVERFNRTYCDEILDMYLFISLDQVRNLTNNRMRKYNGGISALDHQDGPRYLEGQLVGVAVRPAAAVL